MGNAIDSKKKNNQENLTESDWEKIYSYTIHDGEISIKAYKGNDVDVIIPEKIGENKVTEISMYSFSPEGNAAKKNSKVRFLENKLKSVVIPKTVKTIDQFAFLRCKALESVIIPEGVNEILFQSFMECTSLRSISIPSTASYIDSLAFRDCVNLVNVSIANGIDCIGPEAFAGCKNLGEISIPKSVTEIGEEAFMDCKYLNDIYIPESVTIFDNDIFRGCKSRVTIHTVSGSEAEKYAKANKIKCSTNSEIDKKWRSGKIKILSSAEMAQEIWSSLGEAEERLNFSILYLRSGLEKDVGEISNYIRKQKDAIANMCIKFQDAQALHLLLSYIPKAELDWIDKYIKLCSDKDVSLLTTILNYKQQNYSADDIESAENDKLEKDLGMKERTVADWKKIYTFTVTDGEITITSYKGYERDVYIPEYIGKNKVTAIGTLAFSPYRSRLTKELAVFLENELSSVVIPSTVTAIEDNAFSGCTSLANITIPDSVTSIGRLVFSGCTSLVSITIPDRITSIEDGAFSGCTSLVSITIPDRITSIGDRAFDECTSLVSVTIPYGVTSIGYRAFSKCTSLSNITIPDSVTSIGYMVFYECAKELTIYAPSGSYAEGYAQEDHISFATI